MILTFKLDFTQILRLYLGLGVHDKEQRGESVIVASLVGESTVLEAQRTPKLTQHDQREHSQQGHPSPLRPGPRQARQNLPLQPAAQ